MAAQYAEMQNGLEIAYAGLANVLLAMGGSVQSHINVVAWVWFINCHLTVEHATVSAALKSPDVFFEDAHCSLHSLHLKGS